jgi:hypothetical protein
MYTNPYVAQKIAEWKIRDAQREAEKDRMVASIRQPGQGHSQTWPIVKATTAFTILAALSNVVDRIFQGGHDYR